jgi:hypothetical protein
MRIVLLAVLIAFSPTSLYAQRPSVADTTSEVVARELAAVPLELYLADSNLHIINVYKVEATILRESQGRSPEAIVDRLTREVYSPYAAFWHGYLGDETAFRRWAATSLLANDHPVHTRLAAWLDVRLDRLFTASSDWIVRTTGRRPRGTWYIVFGPAWTDMGGFPDGTMLADFSRMQPDSAALALKLAHELTHEVSGAGSVGGTDPDTGTVLSRIVSEGLACYATYVYGTARRLTPAQALGYSESEWAWALAHESDLIAAAKSRLGSRDRADLNRVASRSERLLDLGPTAGGYWLGFRIVQAYVEDHGPASWTNLLGLPVRDVLLRSGYPLRE